MEEILSMAKRVCEEAEVYVASSEVTPVQFETNRLKHIQSKQSRTVALRIIKDGKIGFAQTAGPAEARNLVEMAVETARFGMRAKFEFPVLTPYPRVNIYDAAVETVSVESMVELGQALIDRIRKHTPDLICEGGVQKSTGTVTIMNSRGGRAEYRESGFSLAIEGNLIRGTDMLFVGEDEESCHPLTSPDAVAGVVTWQLEHAKTNAAVSSGTLPVVFTPRGIASAMVSPLMAAFNGKTVLEGASPIGKRLGEIVFDKKLSLWDDPTIDYCPASRPCDDEGTASQRTSLIESGKVAHFLYDLQTAALAGARSTGNGSRSRGGMPAPSPSAFVIAPGKVSFDEMVADMKEGLVIEQLMGAEMGNVLGGDFSGNVLLGYKVERGKIIGRVKDTMVSGNVYRVLKDLRAIGSESRWVGGFLQTPPLYCSGISVASKE